MQWQARKYGSDDDFDGWCKRRRRICWASGSFRYTAPGRIVLGRVPEAQLAALSVLLTLEDLAYAESCAFLGIFFIFIFPTTVILPSTGSISNSSN